MATITRVQHFHTDTVSMLAVQGAGTDRFQSSNRPKSCKAGFGAVFTGNLRVTKSTTSGGYFFLLVGEKGSHIRRAFFKGSALVRIGGEVITVDAYWDMLALDERTEDLRARLRALLTD